MSEDRDHETGAFEVNPGYSLGQLAKSLANCEKHGNAKTRERARQRVSQWVQVFVGILNGSMATGSRTPIPDVPAWATLEVVTGGFATGELLAGGELRDHERKLLSDLSVPAHDSERRTLNTFFLTEGGMSRLREALTTGRYAIDVPEEGALLVVAWLLDNGYSDRARELLEEIGHFFKKLRFFPIPAEQPRRFGSRIHLQDVATTIESVKKIAPNRQILAQREAIEVWAPFYDRTVGLFLETVDGEPPFLAATDASEPTVEGGWPCRVLTEAWRDRAQKLLDEYAKLRQVHRYCRKPDRRKGNFPQLRMWLERCIEDFDSLADCDVRRIRLLLARCVTRRGTPQSSQSREIRQRQAEQVRGPTHHEVAQVVVSRLERQPRDGGLEEFESVSQPVTESESQRLRIEVSAAIPQSVLRKVERCLIDTADALIARGVITSAETFARVLPQVTSGLRAAGITDPILRQLDAAIYRAFRRRRSLLLLNLESQVRIEELPWVAAIDQFRRDDLSTRELAKETLREITALTVVSFPHAIFPNKLVQELRALAKGARLDLPLVEEVAADIFMGEFSSKFAQAAKRAADLLEGTLYEAYYGIDYAAVRKIPEPKRRRKWSWFQPSAGDDQFVQLCTSRAGLSPGGRDVAKNGMIIEQQQILTTQNLAVLVGGLELSDELQGHWEGLARQCFQWICNRQQVNAPTWHALLIMLKNTAYAWRQMIFYLAMIPGAQVQEFLQWADDHLQMQRPDFRSRFQPAMKGLQLAVDGKSIDTNRSARRFLGWTKDRHWILGPKPA